MLKIAKPESNGLFILGVLIVSLALFVIIESVQMPHWTKELYLMAPGFVPLLVGTALLILGFILTIKAVNLGGCRQWGNWLSIVYSAEENRRFLGILALMCLFVVGLIGRVPFSLAVLIFHILIFSYLRIGGYVKIGVISLAVTLLVAVLLPYLFDMPLP